MQELIYNTQILLGTYRSIGKIMLLLTALLGVLTIKSSQRIRIGVIYILIGSLVILNPFFIAKENEIFGQANLYRLGMVLLVPILSAYFLTQIYRKVVQRKQKTILIIGFLVLIAASGKFVYTNDYFHQITNNDKVYNLSVEIADCVTTTNKTPTIAISEVQGVFIRQYNADIKLICAPEITENWKEVENEDILSIRIMLADIAPDMPGLIELVNKLDCEYLVLMESQIKEDTPESYGFVYVDRFDKFLVYENRIGAK